MSVVECTPQERRRLDAAVAEVRDYGVMRGRGEMRGEVIAYLRLLGLNAIAMCVIERCPVERRGSHGPIELRAPLLCAPAPQEPEDVNACR